LDKRKIKGKVTERKARRLERTYQKSSQKKGELDLDDLRKNKEINKIVEKQLHYLLKGKKNSNFKI
jgi:hypothetical protein